MTLTRLTRRKSFQCMHRYEVPAWSEAKNRAQFGACFSPNGHGHDYELEVTLEGTVDPVTGMVVNLIDVDQWLAHGLSVVNGKHLNFEVGEFSGNPTSEKIALFLLERLHGNVPEQTKLVKLRLYEYDDLWVDVWP